MRAHVRGRFIYAGEQKLYLRGVTYGTFATNGDDQFPLPDIVARDFAMMASVGVNAVRTYTPAPRWLLDLAQANGLYVMAGLPWEEHITFLDRRETGRSIEARVRESVRGMAGHPALLAYTIGNEIPGGIARWHGRHRTERFIERLYWAAKEEDPDGLVTYVNFPTTEYLQLPFVDFLSFNVYIEHQPALKSYLARLHNLAGERPLVMAEIGLDSRRNGENLQATVLEWQVGTAFQSGCAGAFVFAWTDEWHRGGHAIDDWDFGIVDRERRPKQALPAVERAFQRVYRDDVMDLPSVSVVVCSYNGAKWLPGCLDALEHVDYPDYEVIVVSDGSTDATDEIAASRPGVRLVRNEQNEGLSAARNLGMEEATGEIIAYLDDDARPDPEWLHYLAIAFERSDHGAIGGPNLAPPSDGDIADCVANSPGGPVHVLLSDDVAEHIPGCNTAVRRDVLREIGGFDPLFRIAGDDVDMCWRLQDAGHTIGFSPAAMVWHHRRNSVRTYLRQQRNYGRAEGLLEQKWPERYNRFGHLSWAGRIYGAGARMARVRRARVGYGTWGSSLFQSIYEPAPGLLTSVALMPEWYIVILALAALTTLGVLWAPMLFALPLLCAAIIVLALRAFTASSRSHEREYRRLSPTKRLKLRAITTGLHMAQPLVRLFGRLDAGLSPWRRRCKRRWAWPSPKTINVWSEQWAAPEEWLQRAESHLRPACDACRRGTDYDRWDLEVRGGPFGVARLLCVIEEHGAGSQLIRFRVWPVLSRGAMALVAALGALAALAAGDGALSAAILLALGAAAVAVMTAYDTALATGALQRPVEELEAETSLANREVEQPELDPRALLQQRMEANGDDRVWREIELDTHIRHEVDVETKTRGAA